MGRIRSIKPEILEDDKTANLSHLEWRLFVSMFVLADDYGNLRGEPAFIQGAVLWALQVSREDVARALESLARVSLVSRYRVRGQLYLTICGWEKHQRVDKPGKPRVPGPHEQSRELGESSRESRESLATDPDPDLDLDPERERERDPEPEPDTEPQGPPAPEPLEPPERERARSTPAPDPRIRINTEAWQLAAEAHAQLRSAGIDATAIPWPGLPSGQAMSDIAARTRELVGAPPNYKRAVEVHRRRVAVAVAEAKRERHLRWFVPSLFYQRGAFERAADMSPEQAAIPRGRPSINGTEKRYVLAHGVAEDDPS